MRPDCFQDAGAGRWPVGGEEEEGLCEEDDDELETRSDGCARGSSASERSKRSVSTLGSGRGGSGRHGDFEGPGNRECTTVVR